MQDISSFLKPIIISIFSIWLLVCFARIFVKAGEWWWKIIIPIYNEYILCKIVGKKWRFWIFMSLPIICLIRLIVSLLLWFTYIPQGGIPDSFGLHLFNYILWIFAFASIVAFIVVYILIQIRLSKSFWKSNWFCVWMILFPFIFAWIIAFDSSIYDLKRLSWSENSKAKVKDKTVKN